LTLNDRVTRGFIAGVAGGVAMSVLDLISYLLGIVEILFLDWAATLIYGCRYATVAEAVVAQAGQLFFSGLAGIIFAALIPSMTRRNLYFKGIIWGLAIWFGAYAITALFKVSPLFPVRVDTVLSNITGALIYGLVLAGVMKFLENRRKQPANQD
jgi:uncharacterized membrane protein YagU involved in acid resistance